MSVKEKFALVWQECGEKNQIAQRFHVPGYTGFLPFLIWGDDLLALEQKMPVVLKEEQLLKGILYGLYDLENQPYFEHHSNGRNTLLYLLNFLESGFHYDDPERLILDVAANVREKNGTDASRIILEVGKELLPKSSRIKSDLICDIWEILFESGKNNSLLEETIKLIPQISLSEINPDSKEVICYYGLCAHVVLGKDELINPYMERYIYSNVTYPTIKNKIKRLLENPGTINIQDLHIS